MSDLQSGGDRRSQSKRKSVSPRSKDKSTRHKSKRKSGSPRSREHKPAQLDGKSANKPYWMYLGFLYFAPVLVLVAELWGRDVSRMVEILTVALAMIGPY